MNLISAIIPVFNEEKTIGKVVSACLCSGIFKEVIVINDGSTDQSLQILKEFGEKIKLINLSENKGKGFVLAKGITVSQGSIVVFVDSDLKALKTEHLIKLVNPLLKEGYDACLGSYSPKDSLDLIVNLTGTRAYFRKDLTAVTKRLSKTRFGAETFLNNLYKDKKVKLIYLPDIGHLTKFKKLPPTEIIDSYITEGLEIAIEIARQKGGSYQERVKIIKNELFNFLSKYLKISKNKLIQYLLTEIKI